MKTRTIQKTSASSSADIGLPAAVHGKVVLLSAQGALVHHENRASLCIATVNQLGSGVTRRRRTPARRARPRRGIAGIGVTGSMESPSASTTPWAAELQGRPQALRQERPKEPPLAALRCLTLQRMRRLSEAAEACNEFRRRAAGRERPRP